MHRGDQGAVRGCVWTGPGGFWITLPSGVQYVKQADEWVISRKQILGLMKIKKRHWVPKGSRRQRCFGG